MSPPGRPDPLVWTSGRGTSRAPRVPNATRPPAPMPGALGYYGVLHCPLSAAIFAQVVIVSYLPAVRRYAGIGSKQSSQWEVDMFHTYPCGCGLQRHRRFRHGGNPYASCIDGCRARWTTSSCGHEPLPSTGARLFMQILPPHIRHDGAALA